MFIICLLLGFKLLLFAAVVADTATVIIVVARLSAFLAVFAKASSKRERIIKIIRVQEELNSRNDKKTPKSVLTHNHKLNLSFETIGILFTYN